MLLVVFVMAEYHALLHSFEIGDFLSVNFSQIVVFCVVAFIFLVFLMFSLGYLDFLNFQTFRILGSLTFPLYLIHQNVGYIILNAVNPFVDKNLLVVLVILGMCVFSYFVNRWFELHIFLRLRKILNSLF
jgi:peptidoglycan/LPS O-acetylase OafA/YrhL